MNERRDTSNPLFRIGNGVGPFGRWFRLFAGINAILFLSLNPILLDPMPASRLGPYFGEVGLWFLLLATAYLVGVWLFGQLGLSRLTPWAGTAIFLGIPSLFRMLGLLPLTFQIAFGFYVGASLIATFFMRYGGCEVVAFPSLLLGHRFTMYCPYNAVDAVERAVAVDRYSRRHRSLAVLSLAITSFIGGYFLLEEILQFFGRYGLAFEIDDRLAWLLFLPAAHLFYMAASSYAREGSLLAAPVRKFGLGAAVLALVTVSLVVPGIEAFRLWLWVLAIGAAGAAAEVVWRALRGRRAGERRLAESGERP